jgi:hypothetical protein
MERPPYWRLISVLCSSHPITGEQAMSLFETALSLHHRDETLGEVVVGPLKGRVQNLRNHVSLGTLGGPSFEAHIVTDRGEGVVRFFLTREALELIPPSASPAAMLN